MHSNQNSQTTMTAPDQLPPIHDVLLVGAGPSGLAVAARLRERTPSALYTDEEHRRFHWLAKHGSRSSVKDRKTGRVRSAASSSSPQHRSLLVLDAESPAWLARWHALFAALRIAHLRSPMFFHPDPGDRDALLAFAHEARRTGELEEIAGCVGKEVSKHRMKKRRREVGGKRMAPATVDERDRKDYFTPSRGVFADFVEGVVERYGLGEEGLVREERVEDVEFGVVPGLSGEGGSERLFSVKTNEGVHYAKAVVLAVGAGNAPCIPRPFEGVGRQHEAACHALAMRGESGLPKSLRAKVAAGKSTNVMVIGGGLTSAQIGDLVIRQGVSKVWHLTRGTLKVKPFDIDLNWMSKFRNQEKAAFWMADDDYERADMLREARGGGSITPRFAKVLQGHVQSGRTALHTSTTVQSQSYDPSSQTWELTTSPAISDLPLMDYIYFATGVQSDVSTLPFMQNITSKFPLETYDGLPTLTDDLAWRDDVPLFLAGKFAGLRLGPGAANLEGARAGAERIVLAIEKMLGSGEAKVRRDSGFEEEEASDGGSAERYGAGLGSRYEWLSLDD
ncbi:hypothetical protein WHR41_01057 [Cladosporium halotolerans]|uniref:L-ornithine N(5)-monooxygenase [NAD(P)H] n=1 Tax=Cladosporium halotolerans TaxID=1052096 RepID=A0AB34KYR3_9PEZI